MKLASMLIAALGAVLLVVVVLLILGVNFRRPLPEQGAELYDSSTEMTVSGVVTETREFACPVSDGEMGSHLLLKTANGVMQVHLAPGRILRSHQLKFVPGEQLVVVGSRVRRLGSNDLIARQVSRGTEEYVFRDSAGKLMLVQ